MISVVVPVYNAEKYIQRCINSIISQTYHEWELILVDDGSSDRSLEIIQEYAKKDKRIKMLHQENRGAGASRNYGIEFVKGKYTVFVDADDYLDCAYFEELSKHDEDVVFINNKQVYERKTKIEKISSYSKLGKDRIIRSQMTGKLPWGGWRKALKTDVLKKYDIRYSEHKVGEEAIYSFKSLYYGNTYAFIDKALYTYEIHSGSLSQTIHLDPWGEAAIALKEELKKMGCYSQYANTVNSFIYSACMVSFRPMAKTYGFCQFQKESKKRYKAMKAQMDNDFPMDKKSLSVKVRLIGALKKIGLDALIYVICRMV